MRSLRNRLAVVFGLIVLGVVGTIYLSTAPQLQDRLRNQRLEALAVDAAQTADALNASGPLPLTPNDKQISREPTPRVRKRAAQIGADILVLRPLRGTPQVLTLIVDSTPDGGVTGTDVQG